MSSYMRWIITLDWDQIFAEFIENTSPWALRLAYAFTKDHGDAEDVVQDTYFRYWRRLQHAHQVPNSAYLYRALMNNLKSWYKKHRWIIAVDSLQISTELGSDIAVRDAICRLPTAQRIAATSVWVLGFSIEEAARVSGLKASSVRSHLSRARRRLDQWLFEEEDK